MQRRLKRVPFVEYDDALEGFSSLREEINALIDDESYEEFGVKWEWLKEQAAMGDAIAMDVLAYYYKSGIKGFIPENYLRYIQWEVLAAGRGNELAIEKMQFLIKNACDKIITSSKYEKIKYKNDIDEYNELYVVGKAICKIVARDNYTAFPEDLVELKDVKQPYTKEIHNNLMVNINAAVDKAIELLIS